jgi:AraC-like DNA-binding protein
VTTLPQNTSAQLPGSKSVILHATSRHHTWSGSGPLSIKSFPTGQAYYTVEGGKFLVDESGYLLLNAGQEYTVTVDSAHPVESFCIFFADGLAEEVYAGATQRTSRLLDDPTWRTTRPLDFYDKFYRHDAYLSPLLQQLRMHHKLRPLDAGAIEERLHLVMQQLLFVHHLVIDEVATLPAMRAATREELYRRLHRVRDFIAASYQQPLTLSEMAQVACLSPNHLLRVFKQLFHQSPHQFLRAKRIEQAKKLLAQGDESVTEICYAVGFESLGSFSWRFHREVGLSPEQYRAINRQNK